MSMTLIQVLENRHEAMTVQEVADLLGVSDKHIYEMTAEGTLPAFHVGRSVRLDPQDVADWLRKKKGPSIESRGAKRANTREISNHVERVKESMAIDGVLRRKIHDLGVAAAMDDSPR